jgi:hypothetical protein
MTDYIKKALEGDYEGYVEFLIKLVDDEIFNKKIPLREAAEAIIDEAFYQLRDNNSALDKLMLNANANLDPPCKDYAELENHTFDAVVEEIHRDEVYTSEKTGTILNPYRI